MGRALSLACSTTAVPTVYWVLVPVTYYHNAPALFLKPSPRPDIDWDRYIYGIFGCTYVQIMGDLTRQWVPEMEQGAHYQTAMSIRTVHKLVAIGPLARARGGRHAPAATGGVAVAVSESFAECHVQPPGCSR